MNHLLNLHQPLRLIIANTNPPKGLVLEYDGEKVTIQGNGKVEIKWVEDRKETDNHDNV